VFVNNEWMPILLTLGVSLLLLIFAFYLNTIRDLEAGFIHAKPGKEHAGYFLQNPLGLVFRLQRTSIVSCAIGMFILGSSYGSIFGDLESYFADNEMIGKLLSPVAGLSLAEQFLGTLMAEISMICTIPPLLIMLNLKGEEKKNRTEHLLSRAVSRHRMMGSYFLLSILMGSIMLVIAAIGLWLASSSSMENPIVFETIIKAACVYLPAVWLMIGLAVLLIGLFPKITSIVWLYLGYSFFVVYLGKLLQVPDWMAKLSPFGNIPQFPVDEINYLTISLLIALTAIIILIGFIGYRKRDIAG
jgi:ABC-2 type transport system permease protein